MQVYRELQIGTAKPTSGELKGVVCHLIDCVDPDQQYNAGHFVRDAEGLICALHASGRRPVVSGGTGMYLKSLLYGLSEDLPSDRTVREQLEREAQEAGLAQLHRELRRVDPQAEHIGPNDRIRILRALEVHRITGRPITFFHKHGYSTPRWKARFYVLDRPRAQLYERIEERVDGMMGVGLLDEVRAYLAAGHSRENPAIRALGYRDLIDHLEGRVSLPEAVAMMKQRTRNFAKRQLTWFRAFPQARWIDVSTLSAEKAAEVILADLS